MTYDEGYIKYESVWAPGPPPPVAIAEELDRWRQELFALGLIGYDDEHEVGYGNISIRASQPGQFFISGHVHSAGLWNSTRDVLPTTNPAIAYGTPAMADEFKRLYLHGNLANVGIAVMAGHEGGLISFGGTLEHAATRILSLARRSAPARG